MSNTAVIGSTGLVGSHILSTLLASDNVSTVHTISRRAPKSTGTKLQAVVEVDTTRWADKLSAIAPPPTTVFSALGTTRQAAGGIANQWKIDHDLNVELARAAKARGVRRFVFVSSTGTRGLMSSWMPYAQMKVGVEDTIRELGFEQAVILRPGLIMGEREVAHQGAWLMHAMVNGLAKLHVVGQGIKDSLAQDAEVIARAAVQAARMAEEGKAPEKYWILEQSDIIRLGRAQWKHQGAPVPAF